MISCFSRSEHWILVEIVRFHETSPSYFPFKEQSCCKYQEYLLNTNSVVQEISVNMQGNSLDQPVGFNVFNYFSYNRPQTKFRKGNVFTPVWHSVHSWGVYLPRYTHLGRYTPRWSPQRTVRILLECFLVFDNSGRFYQTLFCNSFLIWKFDWQMLWRRYSFILKATPIVKYLCLRW